MTLPASALPFGNRLPSADDRQIANQLRRILAAQKAGEATLRVPDPETKRPLEITLTPAVSDLFLELLRHIGSGDAVTLGPIQQMLTTQQAADLLNVSRPYLIKLIERGDIPHSTVGRHRRLKAEDVFAYKIARDKARSDALDELVANDADLY
jgi:excisionase family DNA binding protein